MEYIVKTHILSLTEYGTVCGDYPNGTITAYDNHLTPYLGELIEGGVVVDKRTVEHSTVVDLVYKGPMLDLALPDNTCSKFTMTYPKAITPATSFEGLRSFDYVSGNLYVDAWRKAGAKIGYRRGNVIEWESGDKTQIPSYANRHAVKVDSW